MSFPHISILEAHRSEKAHPMERRANKAFSGSQHLRKKHSVGVQCCSTILSFTTQFYCLIFPAPIWAQLLWSQALCSFVATLGYSVEVPGNELTGNSAFSPAVVHLHPTVLRAKTHSFLHPRWPKSMWPTWPTAQESRKQGFTIIKMLAPAQWCYYSKVMKA